MVDPGDADVVESALRQYGLQLGAILITPARKGLKPFQRLIAQRQLGTYRHRGFWQPMDTFKDKIGYDRMAGKGDCPWMVWQHERIEPVDTPCCP